MKTDAEQEDGASDQHLAWLIADAREKSALAKAALSKLADYLQQQDLTAAKNGGDRLIGGKELLQRLGIKSKQTLRRAFREGRYGFLLRDGNRIVASETGLDRWIAARTLK